VQEGRMKGQRDFEARRLEENRQRAIKELATQPATAPAGGR